MSVAYNDLLAFTAFEEATGRELWLSDGTAAGTRMVTEIAPGVESAAISYLTVVGDLLYFSATDELFGAELWRSDGTAEGTYQVRDIRPGPASSNPAELTAFGPWVVFSANDGLAGGELWVSGGTSESTRLLADILPGSESSLPENITIAGESLLFSKQKTAYDIELWRLPALQDSDTDLIPNVIDNCRLVHNPNQLDADQDGFGNLCDGDFDGDCQTDFFDFQLMRESFFSNDPVIDLDGNGVVDFTDLAVFKGLLFNAPGPGSEDSHEECPIWSTS